MNAARGIALGLVAQMALGPVVNFALLAKLTAPPGFLANHAANAQALSLAVVLGLAMAAIHGAIAIAFATQVSARDANRSTAYSLLGLGIAAAVLMAAEYGGWLAMASLARQQAAGTLDVAHAFAAASALRGAFHHLGLLLSCATSLAIFIACFTTRLVPRWLAGAGALASLSALVAASLPIFGKPVALDAMMPLGLVDLVFAGWLAVRGFGKAPAPG